MRRAFTSHKIWNPCDVSSFTVLPTMSNRLPSSLRDRANFFIDGTLNSAMRLADRRSQRTIAPSTEPEIACGLSTVPGKNTISDIGAPLVWRR